MLTKRARFHVIKIATDDQKISGYLLTSGARQPLSQLFSRSRLQHKRKKETSENVKLELKQLTKHNSVKLSCDIYTKSQSAHNCALDIRTPLSKFVMRFYYPHINWLDSTLVPRCRLPEFLVLCGNTCVDTSSNSLRSCQNSKGKKNIHSSSYF